jgi:hypothetical protein
MVTKLESGILRYMSKTNARLPDTSLYLHFTSRNFPITKITFTYNIEKEQKKLRNLIANGHKYPTADTTGYINKW